ncbi:GntR family transcriptional regulator [Amycolatopsis sp. NPDC049868]|uniref:GntR family transcriptional regulator n=1 Tax=Amycolatopsis sp. NPDC049868 TaxID=3363934 RepID=UPI0037B72919
MNMDAATCSNDVANYLDHLLLSRSPGDRLPSERDLARTLGVARNTVRIAIQQLIVAGRLVRWYRRGIFVAEPKGIVYAGDRIDRFFRGRAAVRFDCLASIAREEVADAYVAKLINIAPGHPTTELERVLSIGEVPMATESLVAPRPAIRCSAGLQTSSCPCVLCIRRFTLGAASVSSELAGGEHASSLRVSIGHPLLVVEQGCSLVHEGIMAYRKIRYRADRFRMVVGKSRHVDLGGL